MKLKWHILCVNKEETPVDGTAYLECGECGWHVWISQNEVDLTWFDVYQFWGDTHMAEVSRAHLSGRTFVP